MENRTNPVPFILAFIGLVIVACLRQDDGRKSAGAVAKAKPTVVRPPAPVEAEPDAKEPAPKEVPKVAAAAPHRVVLVSVDGWHVKLTERMPVWKAMAAEGSWTLSALVPKGATTVLSHGELYTGAEPKVNGATREPDKKTDKDPHVHGVKFRWTPLKVSETLFTATEGAGHTAIAVVQKGKLIGMLRPDGSEAGIRVAGDAKLLKTACAAVKDDTNRLVILHIGAPDGAGHKHGWLSDEQWEAAAEVDATLTKLRACITDAEKAGGVPTTLIVTSDHGGTPVETCMEKRSKARCGHGANDADNRRVPWVAVGPGIKAGYEIQGGVTLADTAPTILRILGIPTSAMPSMTGSEISEIF